jgi:UDPglucose 6-dehydrogenase
MRERLRQPIVVDLRNVYGPADMLAAGFIYHGIGRPSVAGQERRTRK